MSLFIKSRRLTMKKETTNKKESIKNGVEEWKKKQAPGSDNSIPRKGQQQRNKKTIPIKE